MKAFEGSNASAYQPLQSWRMDTIQTITLYKVLGRVSYKTAIMDAHNVDHVAETYKQVTYQTEIYKPAARNHKCVTKDQGRDA